MPRPQVLLVDADAARREALVVGLGAAGLDVRGVAEPRDAALALNRTAFHLVLLADDSPLPVLARIRASAPRASFVVIAGRLEWSDAVALSTLGALEIIAREAAVGDVAAILRRLAA